MKQEIDHHFLSTLKLYHLKDLPEFLRDFQERQEARRMEIVSKLMLEEEQKKRQDKRHALLVHPPARVAQSMALKRRQQRLLQNLMPLSAHSEREVKKNCSSRAIGNTKKYQYSIIVWFLIFMMME